MTIGLENTLTSLHRHIADYRPQLERAIAAPKQKARRLPPGCLLV
ncbi:hypothetical protein [Egbenema bharatensis]